MNLCGVRGSELSALSPISREKKKVERSPLANDVANHTYLMNPP
jgi:hypothetical protein